MSSRDPQRTALPGVVVHGSDLWLSELLSVLVVAAVVAGVLVSIVHIVRNERAIDENQRIVWQLEKEDLDLRHQVEVLQAEHELLVVLRKFIGRHIPDERLYLLTYLVFHNSQQFGYDPLLVLAVIRVESYFDPTARGMYKSGRESGALGLMQLKFETAQLVAAELGIPLEDESELFKPEVNIPLGIGYLAKQIRYFSSLKLGILAYNQGPGTVLENIKQKHPLSTRYYQKVLKAYYRLKRLAETE